MSADGKERQSELTNGIEVDPVARLEFLDSHGNVREFEEYFCEADFIKALQEELYYGVPLIVVLYRNQAGETIPTDFLESLDTLPKGLRVEELRRTLPENVPKKNARETIHR